MARTTRLFNYLLGGLLFVAAPLVSVHKASAQGLLVPFEEALIGKLAQGIGEGIAERGAAAVLGRGAVEEGLEAAEARAASPGRYGRPQVKVTNNNFEFAPQISLPSTPASYGQPDRSSAEDVGPNTTLTPARNEFLQRIYESEPVTPNETYALGETKTLSREQMAFLRSVYK